MKYLEGVQICVFYYSSTTVNVGKMCYKQNLSTELLLTFPDFKEPFPARSCFQVGKLPLVSSILHNIIIFINLELAS